MLERIRKRRVQNKKKIKNMLTPPTAVIHSEVDADAHNNNGGYDDFCNNFSSCIYANQMRR